MEMLHYSDILSHSEKFLALRVVAEQGSLRKASEVLGISQPSLSVKLRSLEEALSYQLLERSSKGVALTTQGHRALQFVNRLIDDTESFRLELEAESGILKGHLRIGMYDSIARYIWPEFYKQLSKTNPDISISIFTGRSQMVIEELESQRLDLAVTIEPRESFGVDVQSLYQDCFSFYAGRELIKWLCGKGHLIETRGEHVFENCSPRPPLILFSRALSGGHTPLENLIKTKEHGDFLIHRVESFEIAHAFCLEGIGIAVLPQRVAQTEVHKGTLLPIKMTADSPIRFGQHTIGLSILSGQKHKPIVEHVAESLAHFVSRPFPEPLKSGK